MVTVESAFAISAIVTVMMAGLLALSAMVVHVRCVDAAREAARVAAYDTPDRARTAALAIVKGARVSVTLDDTTAVATVVHHVSWLAGIDLGARAVAAREDGGSAR